MTRAGDPNAESYMDSSIESFGGSPGGSLGGSAVGASCSIDDPTSCSAGAYTRPLLSST
jgi:hypothetical protein